jgi:hypothetical protein
MSRSRVRALERKLGGADNTTCPGGVTVILDADEPVPPDVLRCHLCHRAHVLRIDEVAVDAPGGIIGG